MPQEKPKVPNSCIIALGANLPSTVGGEIHSFRYATLQMMHFGLHISAVSRFFQTPSYPNPADPPFINATIMAKTRCSASALLPILHEIESKLNRKREQRWAARTLDLDLLDFNGCILPDLETAKKWQKLSRDEQPLVAPDELVLPHPRLHERAFVLEPLCDIAPQWRHPLLGQTAQELKNQLREEDFEGIIPLKDLQ